MGAGGGGGHKEVRQWEHLSWDPKTEETVDPGSVLQIPSGSPAAGRFPREGVPRAWSLVGAGSVIPSMYL